ncbi:universal stress protein [Streptomyces sp. NPDC056061]|uniref:universal stress protein n=1 Tax=Streptomyces sp. NPDC056061 TaxID=3345700 RepID=UPI0035D8BE76
MDIENPVRSELAEVVVGIDGSPSARTAALWAAAEADRRSRPLCLVHAIDTDRHARASDARTAHAVREASHDLLAETVDAVRERFPDLDVTKKTDQHEPVSALLITAGRQGTVVVGSRGLGGFSALLLGSVGLGVAAGAEVPVVVVRGEAERPESGSVTAAVRDSADLGWLLLAAAEADIRKAALRIVSVWNVLAHVGTVATMLDDLDEIAQRRVRDIKELADRVRERYPGLIVGHHVEAATSTPGALVEASAHTDLIVMGRGHPSTWLGPSLGRVAHTLVHHAHCPVEIVPAAFATPGSTP